MKRIVYLDLLKIFACIGVVTIHVVMQNVNIVPIHGYNYNVINIISSMVRYAVPIFIMVSGVNLLNNNKDLTIHKIFSKYIVKMMICYIFWSIIYALCFKNMSLEGFVRGNYHLWYLLMLIGLYLITPILREITKSIKMTKYFIILGIIFAFIIPSVFSIMKLFPSLDESEKMLYLLNKRIAFGMVVCYPVYYMLGYYLHNIDISKKKEYIIYAFGLIGVFITALLSYMATSKSVNVVETFYDLSNVFILFESIAVFVLFKKYLNFDIKNSFSDTVINITKYMFGVYLIHPLILDKSPLTILAFNPLISIPIIVIIVFLSSLILSIILNHIPIVKKWLV